MYRDDEHWAHHKTIQTLYEIDMKIDYTKSITRTNILCDIFIRFKLAILLSLWINIWHLLATSAINSVVNSQDFYEINYLFHTLFIAARPIKRHFFATYFLLNFYLLYCFDFHAPFCNEITLSILRDSCLELMIQSIFHLNETSNWCTSYRYIHLILHNFQLIKQHSSFQSNKQINRLLLCFK